MIIINQALSVLDGKYRLDVHTLTVARESFSVEYAITPPIPDSPGSGVVFMRVEATDALGRTYDDYGGARGLSDDKTMTVGTISGRPGFPPDAHEAELRFVFSGIDFEVEYPLVVSLAETSAEKE